MMKPSEFSGQVAGPNVEVRCLVPPGGDFHAANPSPSAAISVVQSDLALPLGLGRDGCANKPFSAICPCIRPVRTSRNQDIAVKPIEGK